MASLWLLLLHPTSGVVLGPTEAELERIADWSWPSGERPRGRILPPPARPTWSQRAGTLHYNRYQVEALVLLKLATGESRTPRRS